MLFRQGTAVEITGGHKETRVKAKGLQILKERKEIAGTATLAGHYDSYARILSRNFS